MSKKGSVTRHLEAQHGVVFMQLPGKKKFHNLFKLVHADQVEEPLTDWLREAWSFAE